MDQRSRITVRLAAETIVADRTLNSWGEVFLLGAQAEGWLVLPSRTGQQKQPRPHSVDDFHNLTNQQIRSLAEKYQNLTQLRNNLRPLVPEKNTAACKVKDQAFSPKLSATVRPKPSRQRFGDDLKKLKHPQIRSLAEKKPNPTKPRQNLRSRDVEKSVAARKVKDPESSSALAVLTQAVEALKDFQPTPECQPLLLELQQLTEAALEQIS
jgi:hypothetical protein